MPRSARSAALILRRAKPVSKDELAKPWFETALSRLLTIGLEDGRAEARRGRGVSSVRHANSGRVSRKGTRGTPRARRRSGVRTGMVIA